MERELKKGIIEIFVLAVVLKEKSYGYKIVSDLKPVIKISESTLYPILRRLEKQNKLKTYNKVIDGRNRKYYEITKSGREEVEAFKADWKNVKEIYETLVGEKLWSNF